MTPSEPRLAHTLAIHPNSGGMGWIAFKGPFTPFDWATVCPKKERNLKCLRAVDALITRFVPDTLVLEAFERTNSKRGDRIASLCRSIVRLAADHGIETAIYTRGDVQATFAAVGAKTRDEIAEIVARSIEPLRESLPKRRKTWESEHRLLSVFSAAALVLTHYQVGAGHLLDGIH